MPESLKRYTELPFILESLEKKRLVLLNPNTWDDKNDYYFVKKYKEKKSLKSVLALCLTEAPQTYHHWKVFTHGSSGACLHFKKKEFENWVNDKKELVGRKVEYKTVPGLTNKPPKIEDLPFIKRKAYEHEEEYRLLYESKTKSSSIQNFEFPIEIIDRVLLNPWIPQETFKSLERLIHTINGCEFINVVRATIVKNDKWRKIADDAMA